MRIRPGMVLKDKNTGRVVVVKSRSSGNGHWNCACGKKNHRLHETTIRKYYVEVT